MKLYVIIKKIIDWVVSIFIKEKDVSDNKIIDNSKALVDFDTNVYIHNSYHHKKSTNRYNIGRFLSIIRNSRFKKHKEFNEISNHFPISIEVLCRDIINELEDNSFQKRLEVFFKDLDIIIKDIETIVSLIDIASLRIYLNLAKRYSFSNPKNVPLAKANIVNLLTSYQRLEKDIITEVMTQLATLVESNYKLLFGQYWYDDGLNRSNITEDKISNVFSLLYGILLSKNITQKEILDVFDKLMSDVTYHRIYNKPLLFYCSYPHPVDYNSFENKEDYYVEVSQFMDNLCIGDRFNKFVDLFYEETKCHYVVQILNTELSESNEITYGNITYYNEKVYKSKGYRNPEIKIEHKDSFSKHEEVKAILQHKTKRYFPNVTFLEARSIIENNIILMKLLGNRHLRENTEYFKPDISKMDVSYSYFALDEDFFSIGGTLTIYDGDNNLDVNTIYPEFFNDQLHLSKFDDYIKHINYKQKESNLTQSDLSILQALNKFKKSVESNNFTDVLQNTWNAFEFLTRSFSTSDGKKLNNNEKVDKVINFVELIYSQIYMNEHYRWNLTESKYQNLIKKKSNRLVIYAYFYRNRIIHDYLVETSFMISISRGLNIILANFLNLLIQKIIINTNSTVEEVFMLMQSDLEQEIEKLKV